MCSRQDGQHVLGGVPQHDGQQVLGGLPQCDGQQDLGGLLQGDLQQVLGGLPHGDDQKIWRSWHWSPWRRPVVWKWESKWAAYRSRSLGWTCKEHDYQIRMALLLEEELPMDRVELEWHQAPSEEGFAGGGQGALSGMDLKSMVIFEQTMLLGASL